MRDVFHVAVVMCAVLLVFPLMALSTAPKGEQVSVSVMAGYSEKKIKTDSFKVLLHDQNKTVKMSDEDYIFGVVAAEMPASFETEALKAQAVAAYSFACRRRTENADREYDITTDPKVDQSFMSEEKAREKWGDSADGYTQKIRSAVKSVSGQTVNYKGGVALTLYHAISSGTTESSAAVFGGEYEYLTCVDSVWDKLSPDYLSKVSFSLEELNKALGDKCKLSSVNDIRVSQVSKTGCVSKVKVGSSELTGEELRKALSLRSLNFTAEVSSDKLLFTVKGYGHGVGMSQYGANYMAKQGNSYKEILTYYYKGTTVG